MKSLDIAAVALLVIGGLNWVEGHRAPPDIRASADRFALSPQYSIT